ncbi:MAG: carboxymuconolactone decarboxylase family protein [Chloroflexi bacterium]|nr:carboxymuconolactone decarboxylase family protein [Chloroflexota bacterium]
MKNKRAWIHVLPEEEAEGELKALYEQEFDSEKQGTDNILAVHSLNPPTLRAHADLYHTVMHAKSPLGRSEREMVAVVVSAINKCHY